MGIPLEGLALVIGIDQVLKLFRCVLNVSDDLVTSVVMDRFIRAPHTREEIEREVALEAQRQAEGSVVVIENG